MKKAKLLLAACETHEPMSAALPVKLSTPEVLALPNMTAAELLSAEPPNMALIGEIPWLANEMCTICEPRAAAIADRVKTQHWVMYLQLFPDEDPPEAQAMEEDL